jgi:hypothetical protein
MLILLSTGKLDVKVIYIESASESSIRRLGRKWSNGV